MNLQRLIWIGMLSYQEGTRVIHTFVARTKKSQLLDFARQCILLFSEPHSRKIHVLTDWAFPDRSDLVLETLAFLLLGLSRVVLVRLHWATAWAVALSWGSLAGYLNSGSVAPVCYYRGFSRLGSFWHCCWWFFGRLLPIGLCGGVGYRLHPL